MKLAPLTFEQCQHVRRWRNDCLETLRTPYPLTEEMQAQFYRDVVCNRNSPHRYWAVKDTVELVVETFSPGSSAIKMPTEAFIGMGGIVNIQWESRIGEISLIIDPGMRKKGYGEKAVDLLLDTAFNQMGLNCVYGECYSCNEASGFWGRITNNYGGHDVMLRARKLWQGKFWSSLYFDILKDEYERTKSS